jgi:isoleucyl-tRNA synthetase
MLVQGIQRWESVTGRLFRFDERLTSQRENLSANIMDAWITATLHNLIKFFLQEMANYRLYTVVPKLVEFLELLTNWYVRLNRPRLRGERGDAEAEMSLSVLLNVMLRQTILMSPFVPFVAEMFYQDLSKVLSESSPLRAKSVHFIEIPQPDLTLVDQSLEDQVRYMREIIFMGRKLREAKKLSLKQPLAALHIFAKNSEFLKGLDVLIPYLREELNVAHVTLSVDETSKYSEQVA